MRDAALILVCLGACTRAVDVAGDASGSAEGSSGIAPVGETAAESGGHGGGGSGHGGGGDEGPHASSEGSEATSSFEATGTADTTPPIDATGTESGAVGEIPDLEWVSVSGTVEAGPFAAGSTVTFSALDSLGYPYGLVFDTVVNDDTGAFGPVHVPAGVVLIAAHGRYYDVVIDATSDAPLDLEVVAVTDGSPLHINVLGHIAAPRILQRLHDGNTVSHAFYFGYHEALSDALNTSVVSANGQLNLSPVPTTLSLRGPDDGPNAFLLATIATLQASTRQAHPHDPSGALQLEIDALATGDQSFDMHPMLLGPSAIDRLAVQSNVYAFYHAHAVVAEAVNLDRVIDTDDDWLFDFFDNCDTFVNEYQFDSDGDGIGDVCDCDLDGPDPDGDGWPSGCDTCDGVPNAPYSDYQPGYWENPNWDDDDWGNACDSCPRSSGVGGVVDENCCDPRSYECHATEWSSNEIFHCVLWPSGDRFQCETSRDCLHVYAGSPDPACDYDTPPWLPPGGLPGCPDGEMCTSRWCTVGDDTVCPGATCIPWFGVGDAPAGLGDLGICALADVGPCMGSVGRDCALWYGQ